MSDSKTTLEMAETMMIPVYELDFSVRTHNRLIVNNINYVGDLCQKTPAQLLSIKGFGRKCLNEIVEFLQHHSLSLEMKIPKWETKSYIEIVKALNEQNKLELYIKKQNEIVSIHLRKVEDLNLSVRSYRCLKKEHIEFVGDLAQRSEASLLKLRNFGRKSLLEIKEKLSELNLALGMTINDWPDIDSNDLLQKHNDLIKKDKEAQKHEIKKKFEEKFEFLEDELYYIANHLNQIKRNADIAIKYFGWAGNLPRTLESVGNQFNLTRERVRQIINSFVRRVNVNKNKKIYFLKFEKCHNILIKRIPNEASLVEEELLEKKLVKSKFRVESIIKFIKELYQDHQSYIIRINKRRFVVDKKYEKIIKNIIHLSKKKVEHYGVAKINDITSEIQSLHKVPFSDELAESVLSLLNGFQYLDKNDGWFWLSTVARNRVINQITKILSVTNDIDISELRSGISRHHRMKGCSPPRRVLLELCKQIECSKVINNSIILDSPLDYEKVLGNNEWLMISILKEYGPVLDYYTLRSLCLEYGMKESSFYLYLCYSPVLTKYAPLIYGIRGAKIMPGEIEDLKKDHKPKKVLKDYGWTEDGKIWIAHEISDSMLRMGNFSIPASMKPYIEDSYSLKTADSVLIGELRIEKFAGWGLKEFFNRRGGELGDFLVALFVKVVVAII